MADVTGNRLDPLNDTWRVQWRPYTYEVLYGCNTDGHPLYRVTPAVVWVSPREMVPGDIGLEEGP